MKKVFLVLISTIVLFLLLACNDQNNELERLQMIIDEAVMILMFFN